MLGMHRSGTSWLAGSLEEKGLPLGDVAQVSAHNARGNRENARLQRIHGSVLRDNGGSWDNPTWPNEWSPEARRKLDAYIRRMCERYPMWGVKDPRLLLLLDEWQRQVAGLRLVGIFRHPLAVHASLNARNGSDEARSVWLWSQYNERLVAVHREDPFPILRFDVSAPRRTAQLDQVARELGLRGADAPNAFFSDELVHHPAEDMPVPDSCAELWSYLCDHALVRTC
jgi:hypothetical protein